MKKYFLLLFILISVSVYGQRGSQRETFSDTLLSGDFSYVIGTINNNTRLIITGYSGSNPTITIPSSINNIIVTHIGDRTNRVEFNRCTSIIIPNSVISIDDSVFTNSNWLISINVDTNNLHYSSQDGVLYNKNKTQLLRVPRTKSGDFTILSSVTQIGAKAFYRCNGITSIIIPNSVTSIGESAFANCQNITHIYLPKSINKIGDSIFYGCKNLTEINIDSGNTVYYSIDGVLYNATNLIKCPEAKIGNIIIPEGIIKISASAFSGCENITSISLPDSLSIIENAAFHRCRQLNSITIPAMVIRIDIQAFQGCMNLNKVTFQGIILDFSASYTFPGDLRDKYLAFGIGTYTRPAGDLTMNGSSSSWIKQ